MERASYMLTGEAMTEYYKVKNSAMTFDDFCKLIQGWYKTPEWNRNNHIKWETITLAKVVERNPTLSTQECLCKLCTEMDDLQQGLNVKHQGPKTRRENLIRACRGHPALLIGLSHAASHSSYTDVVNAFDSAIVEYKLVHNPAAVSQSYVQEEDTDNDAFFTERKYHKNKLYNRGRTTDEKYIKSGKGGKRCWMCHKTSCWSTNHSPSEIKESRSKFKDKHPNYKKSENYKQRLRQYILDFEGEDPGNDSSVQYFEEPLPDPPKILETGEIYYGIGALEEEECQQTAMTLANRAFTHSITGQDTTTSVLKPTRYQYDSTTSF